MNREILYRGKRVDNGEWVESKTVVVTMEGEIYLPAQTGEESLFMADMDEQGNILAMKGVFFAKVDPTTRGEYTGLKDRNAKRIFEGDIVTGYFDHEKIVGCIVYGSDATFYIERVGTYGIGLNNASNWLEVICNIHDNPELLKEESNNGTAD